MNFLKIVRSFFQLLAFAIFVYQMVQAINKFTNVNTIESVEVKDIKDVTMPVMIICEMNQYDLDVAEQHGYSRHLTVDDFLFGTTWIQNSIAWGGFYNLSHQEITKKIWTWMVFAGKL